MSGPGPVTFADASRGATSATFSAPGEYVLKLTASDGLLTASDDMTVRLNGVNNAPTVNAGADLTVTLPNKGTLNGTATDDGLPLESTLAVTWTKVSGPGAVTFTNSHRAATVAGFGAAGTYVLRLSASDSALTTEDDVTVTVNPTPPLPTVAFNSLTDGEEITAPRDIIGTVSGGAWRLEYALLEDETAQNWRTVSSGTGAVTNGLLGRLDPTTLINGVYAVRLVSTDEVGQTSILDSSVVVAGQMKVGNFTISFTDLSLPLAGIPVEVTRSYNSHDKRVGDFGTGWTLGVKSARLQKTVTIGKHWYETVSFASFRTYCLESTRPQIVSVTFGGEKVYKFKAEPAQKCQQFVPFESVQMKYTPLTGTRAALTAASSTLSGRCPAPSIWSISTRGQASTTTRRASA